MTALSLPIAAGAAPIQEWIGELFELTRAMARCAGNRDWDQLARIERRRRRVISELFATECVRDQAAAVRAGVRQILEMDRRTIEQSEAVMRDIGRELERLGQGRRAVQAYRQADGD
jgi:hypothetical protein